jgi:serine/threonine-protein kinase
VLFGAGAVLVSVAVAAALLLGQGGPAPAGYKRYPGSTAAPVSFEYPGGWEARTHADEYLIASPAAAEFDALFSVPIASDWTAVNSLLSTHPDRAIGVFTGVNDTITTSDAPETLKRSLSFVLPGPADFASAPTTATVAGKPAFRLTGVVNDPAQQGRLDLVVYIVGRGPGQPVALLTFFCPPARCDQTQIERLVASTQFIQ